MSNDDPFTLDLVGNTALSTGIGLGVTAFGSDFAANDTDDDPPPMTPSPQVQSPKRRGATSPSGSANFFLSESRGVDFR